MTDFETVQPGSEPSIPVQADDHALVRVAKTNQILADKMTDFINVTKALHEAVKVNTATILKHTAFAAENNELLKNLNREIFRLIDAIETNTQAIADHQVELVKSRVSIDSHREASEKLHDALGKLS